MASKQTVLLLGATGQTGKSVLDGLLEDGNFDIKLLTRPASVDKPAVQAFKKQGLEVVTGDPANGADELAPLFQGIDTVISTIDAQSQHVQLSMVEACKRAGVKRFVPCAWITICPPHGVMRLREHKEVVYQEIFKQHVPYTIIDVGWWHQISFPTVPSGKVDYASVQKPNVTIFGDGKVKSILTDLRDLGRYCARIVRDERTLNKFVYTWSDVLSLEETFKLMEDLSGEKIERQYVSGEEVLTRADECFKVLEKDPTNFAAMLGSYGGEYSYSKYIRGDNTPEIGKYLGYLDAQELYPDFKPITFEDYLKELLAGKAKKVYEHWDL
ncbi:MAG: hypothetical protein M1821_005611 [Bathelium mastoideum]|nr:MAG: hypothetical protein M1821_005611 [Bathelium mastoideum]